MKVRTLAADGVAGRDWAVGGRENSVEEASPTLPWLPGGGAGTLVGDGLRVLPKPPCSCSEQQ